MKIGRNSPCPCGSGKKYKRCCADKDLTDSPGKSVVINDEDYEDYEDDEDNEARAILNTVAGMRMMLLGSKPHIKQYKGLRRLHSEVLNAMMVYHEQGKFDQKVKPGVEMPKPPDDGMIRLVEASFDFDTNKGSHGLAEIFFYPSAPGKTCITDDFINSKRYKKPEKIEFLHSMLNSKPGLFEVTKTDIGEAYVVLRNVFTGEEYEIVDIGLSGSPNSESLYIYSRIISYQGVSFNSGLNLLFRKSDPFIREHIERNKADYKPLGELTRFIELYNEYINNKDRLEPVITNF